MNELINLAITSISADSNPAASGPISLIAGTGITLMQTGGDITISSSGGGSSPWQEGAGLVTLVNPANQVNLPTGSGSFPSLIFGAGTEGMATHDGLDINFYVNSNNVCSLSATGFLLSDPAEGYSSAFMNSGFGDSGTTGIGICADGSSQVGLVVSSLNQLTVDNLAAAGETCASIRPFGEPLNRIMYGPADSGGVGFRALIIPN